MKATCRQCGKRFDAIRPDASLCGPTCRKRASRAKQASPARVVAAVPDAGAGEHPLITTTRRELEEAGKLDTVVGQQALRLAEKLAAPFDTGAAAASLSKELRAVMADAMADVTPQSDGLDELGARRLKKASGG